MVSVGYAKIIPIELGMTSELGCTCGAGDHCPGCNKPEKFEGPDFSYFINKKTDH
jgi:hypothetical protein